MVIVAILLPFSISLKEITWYSLIPFIILSLVSFGLILVSYRVLLSTNNPADRYNFFSINKRYESRMKGSINDMGMSGIVLQQPTNKELSEHRKKIRKKKLEKLNKNNV